MTFAVATRVSKSRSAVSRRVGACAAALAAAALLAACGGGDQAKEFVPTQLVSFGDEASVLTSKTADGVDLGVRGLKYTVNHLVVAPGFAWPLDPLTYKITSSPAFPPDATFLRLLTPGTTTAAGLFPSTRTSDPIIVHDFRAVERSFTLDVTYKPAGSTASTPDEPTLSNASVAYQYVYDCTENPLWNQLLAAQYGLGFSSGDSACPQDNTGGAVSYAQARAKVADVAAQVASHRSELGSSTMVTMMAGRNDIFEALAGIQGNRSSEAAVLDSIRVRGAQLAAVVNDIIKTGARVVLVTLPDQSYTPRGQSLGSNDRELLSRLTSNFNRGLTGTGGIENNGNKIALVRFDNYFAQLKSDLNYDGSLVNITAPVCASGLDLEGAAVTDNGDGYGVYCNGYTLGAGLSESQYFWADSVNLSPGAHARLGSLAYQRAQDNNL